MCIGDGCGACKNLHRCFSTPPINKMRNWTFRKEIVQKRIQDSLNRQRDQWRKLFPPYSHGSWREERHASRIMDRMRREMKEKLGVEGLQNLNRPGEHAHPAVVSFIGSLSND